MCVFFIVGDISKMLLTLFAILTGIYEQPYFFATVGSLVLFCNSLSLRNAIYGADGSAEMTAYAL